MRINPMNRPDIYKNLWRDLFFIVLSILVAVIIVRVGVVKHLVTLADEASIFASFFAGVFFTSAFTLAPASVALVEISQNTSIFLVAFWGALGAVVGDLVLFLFIRDRFADDIMAVLHTYHDKKLTRFFHRKFFKWLNPIIGAFIIASPLPDEMGVALLGAAKIRTRMLILISFIMNFIGVLLVALAAGTFVF